MEEKEINKVVEAYQIYSDMQSFDKQSAKKKLFARTVYRSPRRAVSLKSIRIAAMIVVPIFCIAITYFVTDRSKKYSIASTEISVTAPKTGVMEYMLSDSSRVWLGNGSKITFPSSFENKKCRNVIAKGECYFKVTHDQTMPFNVYIGNVIITVKGTEFNCYEKDDEVIVTLIKGEVDVTDENNRKIRTLYPDEQLIYTNSTKESIVKKIASEQFTAWLNGEMNFNNSELDFVADRIAKQFNVEVKIENKALYGAVINAKFSTEGLYEVLDVVSIIAGCEYKVEKINGRIKKVILF